ncbi:response regulator [Endozoicomonas elysicola]|uniref:Transcriptional regulatory protein n=1 Tax=Endozoicomonas elysicola TaxID=305900 RepID=A0A081K7Z3_9GAMM|nr:response regulator [Endozoicomonas elysicola]KEI70269.1 chemotaxis protein CheY [Endozoicomonas elysicola]
MVRVVIAEDDRQIAEIQRRFLERIEGFEVVGLAHSLIDARDMVEVLSPDLLMLDIQFPTGTGLELLRWLRASNRGTDVILVTAAQEVDTLREALHGGVLDYILKPLVFERLQASLQKYKTHIERLSSLETLAQKDVDTLLHDSGSSSSPKATSRLPKGVDALTLDKVRSVFSSSHSTFNAEEVGQCIGVSRTTARRYLEYLTSEQQLQAEIVYGTVGRPERRYLLAKNHIA